LIDVHRCVGWGRGARPFRGRAPEQAGGDHREKEDGEQGARYGSVHDRQAADWGSAKDYQRRNLMSITRDFF